MRQFLELPESTFPWGVLALARVFLRGAQLSSASPVFWAVLSLNFNDELLAMLLLLQMKHFIRFRCAGTEQHLKCWRQAVPRTRDEKHYFKKTVIQPNWKLFWFILFRDIKCLSHHVENHLIILLCSLLCECTDCIVTQSFIIHLLSFFNFLHLFENPSFSNTQNWCDEAKRCLLGMCILYYSLAMVTGGTLVVLIHK